MQTKRITRIGVAVSLLVLFELLEQFFFHWPQGGSISLASFAFLFLSVQFNGKEKILLFITWRLLTVLLMGTHFYFPLQFFLDYFIAFLPFLFVSGGFKKGKMFFSLGCVIMANFLRLCVHTLSGALFFSTYAGITNIWIYSGLYNLSYMLPTLGIQILLFFFLYKTMFKIMAEK